MTSVKIKKQATFLILFLKTDDYKISNLYPKNQQNQEKEIKLHT
jgi:hypothetical protein